MIYSVRKANNNINPEAKEKYYPYPKYANRVTLQEIARDIALASSLTRGDVENTIINLIDTMKKYLKMGNIIDLDEFCTLKLTFSSEGSDTPEEVDHNNIKKTKLVFIADKKLKQELQDISFTRLKSQE
ncbi:HU family DNA-binding protein [Bacteroidales bacterium OttesenSCG-928-M11]|nr:HU family DNA-binding protein [Bacteroidales bacterium OttesenSCG-928-M11]